MELTNADLPRVVNGTPDDPLEKRPFSFSFSRELVHAANVKVGVTPFTRNALNNPKVRHELEVDEVQISKPTQIYNEHQKNLAAARALQLNVAPMELALPRRYHPVVAPPSDRETVIRKLVEAKCTHSGMWINCAGAIAFNSEVMLEAGCEIIQQDLDSKLRSSADKLANFKELQSQTQRIVVRMRDEQIVSYSDLAKGEPKILVRFYHVAKGEKGITAYSTISK